MAGNTKRAKRLPPQERRSLLLEAAIEVFCENGVDGTTIHQIADGAGVSYGLFYHYFPSKEKILEEAVETLSILPSIHEYLSHHEAPLRDHLIGLSTVYLEVMEDKKERAWLLFSESRKRPVLANRLSSLAEDTRKVLYDYLDARQRAGEIRPCTNLDVATRVIWSYLFMRLLWIEGEPPVEEHMEIIVDGLKAPEISSCEKPQP